VAKERRRRAYLPAGIVILAVLGGGQYYLSNIFAPADTGSGPGGGNSGGAAGAGTPTTTYQLPDLAVNDVYKLIAPPATADRVCDSVFTPQGGNQFAADLGAPTCQQAVALAAATVTNPSAYKRTTVPASAIQMHGEDSATISSCALDVQGGERLGTFLLTRAQNGWYISGHQKDPSPCVTAN
jgi:hypothetical protein